MTRLTILILLVGLIALINTSFAEETAVAGVVHIEDEDCTSVAYGDHVLFSYTSKFENNTAGPSLNRFHQPFYFHMPVDESKPGIYNRFLGICENTTTTIHYDSLPDADIRPIVPAGSQLYELEESYEIEVFVQKVTKHEDYQIFDALRSANISQVLDLIEQHIGINAMDEYGQSPLMIAVGRQYHPIVAALLNTRQPKVEINLSKSTGFTALFYAVEKASPSILQALLRRGADPNLYVHQSGSRGNTPLHFACMLEKVKHTQLLLDYGSNPHLKNEHGMVPFQMIPRDAVPSSRLRYKAMFEEVYKKLRAASEIDENNSSNGSGEL